MKKLCIISFLLIATSTLVAQTNYEILERNLPYNKFATSFTGNIIGTSENFVMYHLPLLTQPLLLKQDM